MEIVLRGSYIFNIWNVTTTGFQISIIAWISMVDYTDYLSNTTAPVATAIICSRPANVLLWNWFSCLGDSQLTDETSQRSGSRFCNYSYLHEEQLDWKGPWKYMNLLPFASAAFPLSGAVQFIFVPLSVVDWSKPSHRTQWYDTERVQLETLPYFVPQQQADNDADARC